MNDVLIAGMGEVLWDMLPTGRQCGGAPANVIYHANRLGAVARLVSAVGNDALGDELLAFLDSKHINHEFVARNGLPTGTVTVSLKDGIPAYDIHQPAAWDDIPVTEKLLKSAASFSAFVFGSLAQRDIRSRSAIMSVVKALPDSCLVVFDINLRQNFYSRESIEASLDVANILKLNDEECERLADMMHLPTDPEKTVQTLAERFNLKYVILTLGANGSAVSDHGGKLDFYPVADCPRIEDTVGCGDSFLAAWLVDILHGKSLAEAMKHASEVSAFVAAHKGAMP